MNKEVRLLMLISNDFCFQVMDICSTACERHSDNNESAAKMIKLQFISEFCVYFVKYFALLSSREMIIKFFRKYWIRNSELPGMLLSVKVLGLKCRMKFKISCTCSSLETLPYVPGSALHKNARSLKIKPSLSYCIILHQSFNQKDNYFKILTFQ